MEAIAFVLTLGMALGCRGADSASQRQMEDFRREIGRIQSDNEKLNERVTMLELSSPGRAQAKPGAGKTEERPNLKVVRLSPENSGEEPSGPEDEAEVSDEESTEIQVEGDGAPTVRQGSKASRDAKTSASATREYEAAMDLIKRKRYDQALEALSGFLVRYPNDPNADNATYWRGECYYAKRDYARAAEQFEAVVARFPYGNKAADAMLKLGLSQSGMGQRDKAKKTFEELRRAYPKSDVLKKIPTE